MGDKYLSDGAVLACTQSVSQRHLQGNQMRMFRRHDSSPYINASDAIPEENIPTFGVCQFPTGWVDDCRPEIVGNKWIFVSGEKTIDGEPAVTMTAICQCVKGGMIYPVTSGQEVLGELLDKIDEEWAQLGLERGVFVADPINACTGNFIAEKIDIEIGGAYPLQFKRIYNALDTRIGVLGKGWRHSFEIWLEDKKDTIELTLWDGQVVIFKLASTGKYESLSGYIQKQPNGMFEMKTRKNEKYIFNQIGQCIEITEKTGLQTILTYENGVLSHIWNTTGEFTLSYDEQKRLITAADPTGRTAYYTYDEFNMLESVDDILGIKTTYQYGTSNKVLAISTSAGDLGIINEYDKKDRVLKQHFPDGGTVSFEYDERWHRTTYTEQNGNRVRYYQDEKMRNVRTVYFDGHEETDYDDSGRKVRFRDKNGNETCYQYDGSGNLLEEIGPLGAETNYEYNKQNLPVQITTANDATVQLAYDDNRNLISAINPLGHCTQIQYHKGLPCQIDLPDGSRLQATFDDKLNASSVSLPTGAVLQYQYDALNRVSAVTDGNGGITKYSYNKRDDVTEIINADGKKQAYEYTPRGLVSKVTDFNGGIVEYKYNSVGKMEEIINQMGDSTKITYDLMWNITSVTDACGNTTKYSYDKLCRLIEAVDAEGNTTKYEHDPKGNVIAVISPLGARTEMTYDALDRQIKVLTADGASTEFTYDNVGNLTEIRDALGNVTKHEYDLIGQLVSVTDALGNKTTLSYTPIGKVERIVNAKGEQQTYHYYPGGLLKSTRSASGAEDTYAYDKNENLIQKTDTVGNVTRFSYDNLNRVIAVQNALGHNKHFAYDALGNIVQITDENGHVTQYKYSLLGNMIEAIDANGHSTKYDYDKVGRLTKLEQLRLIDDAVANVQLPEYLVTTYEYDKSGKIITTQTPLGTREKYAYDTGGNLISKIDGDGLETLYEYNLVGQLAKVCYADGRSAKFFYNPLSQLTAMKDWLGETKIDLDPMGRATQVTDYTGSTVGYSWDSLGRREKTIYPDGQEVLYAYNQAGLLEKVFAPEGETYYTYDVLGRMKERILPKGVRSSYNFDPLGRITQLSHSNQHGHQLDQLTYTYDPVGNITQMNKERAGIEVDSGLFQYAYDPLGRLTSVLHERNVQQQFSYDSLGNRTQAVEGEQVTNYAYNVANQLIHTQAGDVIHDYSYDKRGNLTQISENGIAKQHFTFDASNRMTKAVTVGFGQTEYAYDGFLNRVKKRESVGAINPAQEVRYTLDRTLSYDNLLMTTGAENQRFTWGNELISANTDPKSMFYLQDHLGSPVRLMHNYDSPLAYDVFGTQTASLGASPKQPFGFTGYQTDAISGLHFAQARYYDANTGRFTAEDEIKGSVAMPMSLNPYLYCLNQPMTLVDRDGLSPTFCGADFHCPCPPRPVCPSTQIGYSEFWGKPIIDAGSPGGLPSVNVQWGWREGERYGAQVTAFAGGMQIFDGGGELFYLYQTVAQVGYNFKSGTNVNVTVIQGSVRVGGFFDPLNSDNTFIGAEAGVSLLSGDIEQRIPAYWRGEPVYFVIGIGGEAGAIGARAYFDGSRIRLGFSFLFGWNASVGMIPREADPRFVIPLAKLS